MCYKVVSEVKMTKESILENVESYIHIALHVDGFWTDTVSATIRKRGNDWEVEQRHSSGGQDASDRLQQEANMGTAMIELSQFLRSVFTAEFKRELTGAYEAKRAKEKAALVAEALGRAKKLEEQDPAIGETKAKHIVDAVKLNAKLEGSGWIKRVSRVVDDEEAGVEWYRAECGSNGAVRFRYYGSRPYAHNRSHTESCTAAEIARMLTNASRANTRIVSEAERREINRQGVAA